MKKFEPKYFATTLESFARQVLSPKAYAKRGAKGLEIMDVNILQFLDDLRGNIGAPLLVNGGGYTQSGLRDVDFYGTSDKMNNSYSAHKYGKALDIKCSTMTAHDVRKHYIGNKDKYPQITFVEVGPVYKTIDGVKTQVEMSWAHFDCRTRITNEDVRYWSPVLGFVSEERVLKEKL